MTQKTLYSLNVFKYDSIDAEEEEANEEEEASEEDTAEDLEEPARKRKRARSFQHQWKGQFAWLEYVL